MRSPDNLRQIRDERRRWRGHHLFEMIDVAKAIRQRCVEVLVAAAVIGVLDVRLAADYRAKAISNQLDTNGPLCRATRTSPMAAAPRIKTTVVGSYPVPDWLLALPSEQALDRRDARRDPHPGAGRHRSRLRRRAFPLRRQSSRDQRHDRVFRAADGGHAHRHHLRRTGRLSLAARHGLPHPAAGGGGRRGRRRHARPAARLRARPAAGVASRSSSR